MKAVLFIIIHSFLFSQLFAQDTSTLPLLEVQPNGRFLQTEKGEPFYYIGDTAWELFHRCTREEVEDYYSNRYEKGFNVIQAVALAELDGLNTPNAYGDKPFDNNDINQAIEDYWLHIDWCINKAAEYGLYIALLPTWGDKVDKLWGVGPVIFNTDNAYKYGQWIAKRYKNYSNIIWVNGGDRDCNKGNEAVWHALAKGIKSIDQNHLMTFHPRGGTSSSLCFHEAEWLDFNMLQSGHWERYRDNYQEVKADYQRLPIKPCIDGEPNYEDHAINWKKEFGWFNDADIRRSCYWNIFAGAMGAVYGAHPIWQMKHDEHEPVGDVRRNWDEALDLPGAHQMGYIRQLMEEQGFNKLSPKQNVLPNGADQLYNRQLALGNEKKLAVYLTNGAQVNIELPWKASTEAYWFNPRVGTYSDTITYKAVSKLSIDVPVKGIDWVLLIDEVK